MPASSPPAAPTTAPPTAPRAALRLTGRPLALLDELDLAWIDALTGVVARHAGEPWRVALEEIEGGAWLPTAGSARPNALADPRPPTPRRIGAGATREATDARGVEARISAPAVPRRPSPRRIGAATTALRRLLGGRAYQAGLARRARSLVLGAPALDVDARTARILAAAVMLGFETRDLEVLLWADVPGERPIELPAGPPPAIEVAAHANVGLVQRALRRAHAIELSIRGDAGPLVRAIAARGLIAVTSVDGGDTVFEIIGPLALCHRTAVYGRALGSLVPLLGACEDFALAIRAEARGQAYDLEVRAPALLPALPPPRPWKLVTALARDLEVRGVVVERAPAPLVGGRAIACPDLRLEVGGRAVWLEIIGFWTPEYLARKVARYAAVGVRDVVLCVDADRACDDDDPPPGACVVRFTRRIDASAIAQLVGAGPRAG